MFLDDYENKKTEDGVRYSRYIASWLKAGGSLRHDINSDFNKWLESLGLSDDEVKDICDMARSGKRELEDSAWDFIKNEERELDRRLEEMFEERHKTIKSLEKMLDTIQEKRA